MKQAERIKHLTDRELRLHLLITQTIMLIGSFILSLIFFTDLSEWFQLMHIDFKEIVLFGVGTGIIIVLVDVIIISIFPAKYYDDGGINRRIFYNISVPYLLLLTIFIAVAEEAFFRGVIQNTFGYIFASMFFALIHVRYLKQPVLLLSVLFVSFYIGYIFELTENLLVTITAHFVIDFVLALLIRFKREV